MDNNKTLENVNILYNNLIKHIDKLINITTNIGSDFENINIEELENLEKEHMNNRNLAKTLLVELPNVKANFMFNMLKDSLLETLVNMTNISTEFQENIGKSIKDKNWNEFIAQKEKLYEYNKQLEKINKKISSMLKMI